MKRSTFTYLFLLLLLSSLVLTVALSGMFYHYTSEFLINSRKEQIQREA